MLDPLISLDPKEQIPDAPDDTYLRLIWNDLSTLEEALSRVYSDWIPRTKWTDLPAYRTRRFRLVSVLLSRWTRNNTLCRALLYFIVLYSWLICPHTEAYRDLRTRQSQNTLAWLPLKAQDSRKSFLTVPWLPNCTWLSAALGIMYHIICCLRRI